MKYIIANIGSSSKKYAAYMDSQELGTFWFEGFEAQNAFDRMLDQSFARGIATSTMEYAAIGIRIVAPGSIFQKHALLNGDYLEHLRALRVEDPLHIEPILSEIDSVRSRLGDIPIFGLSDSAFHRDLPAPARLYGIPTDDAQNADIWRFGYHGFSVGSVVRALKTENALPEKLVVAHLGSGSSVTALRNGKSIDTSMGFSPLEGLIMQTRVGNIDATALLRIARTKHLTLEELEEYLYTKCGLRGISGHSGDTRELLHLEHLGDKSAALALETFAYKTRLHIGAASAALGGIDMLVLTGTIGECSPLMRERICSGLDYLGLSIHPTKNVSESGRADVGVTPGKIVAMHTEEMQEMALSLVELLK